MTRFQSRALAAITATTLGVASVGVQAGADAPFTSTICEARSVSVAYSRVDLADEQAVTRLYERLHRASRTVCGKPDLRDLRQRADWQRCRTEALDNAVAQIGDERLTARHRGEPSLVAEADSARVARAGS